MYFIKYFISMCNMKVTIHSLDQKMIGQHYGLQK